MDDKLTIKISIGERIYPLVIKRGETKKEETIRHAASLISDNLLNYKKQGYKNKDDYDYLAMTALTFAVKAIENEAKEDLSPFISDLKILNYSLEEAMDE